MASKKNPDQAYSLLVKISCSENEDSPGSSSFHGNIYEGDDDLVIDLQD